DEGRGVADEGGAGDGGVRVATHPHAAARDGRVVPRDRGAGHGQPGRAPDADPAGDGTLVVTGHLVALDGDVGQRDLARFDQLEAAALHYRTVLAEGQGFKRDTRALGEDPAARAVDRLIVADLAAPDHGRGAAEQRDAAAEPHERGLVVGDDEVRGLEGSGVLHEDA